MDFKLNYDLPYFKDIYDEIKLKNPQFFDINDVSPNDIFIPYQKFVDFVKFVMLSFKFHELDSTKQWKNNAPDTIDKFTTMKLMLIMKYFEEIKLSQLVSEYYKNYKREFFNDLFEYHPEKRFALLTGYMINYFDMDSISIPIKLANYDVAENCMLYNGKCMRDSDLERMILKISDHASAEQALMCSLDIAEKIDINIPYILYNNIYNVLNDTYAIYGAVKVCYMYASSEHSYRGNPYYDFVMVEIYDIYSSYCDYYEDYWNKLFKFGSLNKYREFQENEFDNFIYSEP